MANTQKPKLIYIINHMDWFWSHRLPLAQGAQDAGWDVTVAATGASSDAELSNLGFRSCELPKSDTGFMPFTIIRMIFSVFLLIWREKPELMHAITLKYVFIAGLAARTRPKIRVVYTIAGLGYLFSGEGAKPRILRALIGPFLRFALKHPNASIIFQNPDDQELMVRHGFVRAHSCHLIRGSGVDTSQFKPSPDLPKSTPIVLMPTRLVHDKGVAVFVAAARLLKKRGVDARFQIAGGVTPHNPLAISLAEMKDMVADGSVEWLGKVEDMPGLLSQCCFVAYPSYYKEGVPKVLLEAAAAGKAIVTTNHPGCREAVIDGETGILVPIKDALALAEAILRLLNNPEDCRKMGEAGRNLACKDFDVRHIVRETLEVYR